MAKDVLNEGRCVYITGQVGAATMLAARQQVRALAMESRERISLLISSGGGSVFDGFALTDEIALLRGDRQIPFLGVAQGLCASMAVSLLQSCDVRVAGPDCHFMVHGSAGIAFGDELDMKAHMRMIDLIHARLSLAYGRRTAPLGGRSAQQWREFFEADTCEWLTAQEALAAGLIDQVIG